MPDQVTQKDFNLMIMQAAFAMCFKPHEEYLSEGQVVGRGLSPLESYSKSCIAKLIDNGSVEFKLIEPTFPLDGADNTLCIKRPVSESQLHDFICKRSEQIKVFLSQSADYRFYLHALIQDIVTCECIEYAEYYAARNNLKIRDPISSNARLRLLVMENPAEKVNALMWMAIKHLSKELSSEQKLVDLDEIVTLAFETYVRYKKLNINMEGYKSPSQIKPSILSGMLELYRSSTL